MDGYAPLKHHTCCASRRTVWPRLLLSCSSPLPRLRSSLSTWGWLGQMSPNSLAPSATLTLPTALLLLNTGRYPSRVGLKELSQVFLTWSYILVQVPALPIVPPHHYSSVCLLGHRGFKGPAQLLHKMSHTGCAIAAFCLIHFKGMLCSYTQQSTWHHLADTGYQTPELTKDGVLLSGR